jgi:hypothetical protein
MNMPTDNFGDRLTRQAALEPVLAYEPSSMHGVHS